jgi:rubrerythrin
MEDKSRSVSDILNFAIAHEVEATSFYRGLAAQVDAPAMKKVFEDFAREEEGHQAKLEAVKRGEYPLAAGGGPAPGLGLAEYLVEGEPTPDMSYADALVLAMKKEKAAYRLYLDLAALAREEATKNLFLALAGEEARHKLRFEIEYDDHILMED